MKDLQEDVPSRHFPDPPEVSIVIPTFRRPEQLRRTVQTCLDQRTVSGSPYEIVIVDNAPEGAAATVVAQVREGAKVSIRYVHEPRQGISHARNAGITSARGQLLALIDDDEWASPDWLWHLTKTQQHHQADVVFGPVYPEFERPPKSHPEFFRRFYTYTLQKPTGTQVGVRSTNNALVRSACVPVDEPFDATLALTGGEDTLFFSRLQAGGARFVWCAEAHVSEAIPPARTAWGYVWRRAFQRGQCRAGTPMLLDPPMRLRTALWMAIGAIQLVGSAPIAGALWLLGAQATPYFTAKASGGLGKLLWMRRFRTPSYGGGAPAETTGFSSEPSLH